jgi:hypothetical protein
MAKLNFFRVISCIVILSFSTNASFAQYTEEDEDTRIFWGGLTLGTNVSQISGDYLQGYRKIGLNAGAVTFVKLTNRVALGTEIIYDQKGSKPGSGEVPFLNAQNKAVRTYFIDLPYASLPFYINYYDKNKSSLGMGICYSRLFGETEMVDSVQHHIGFPFKRNDFGILLNGNLGLYKNHLILNFRFTNSLSTIRSAADLQIFQQTQQSNKVLTTRLIWLF